MNEIYPGLFYLESENQKELGDRFKRFYGHYESPKLRKKNFSEKRFDSWFKNHTIYGKENLSFNEIVGGVNIPNWVFEPFIEGRFDPLNSLESDVIKEVKKIKLKKFYIISAIKEEWFDFEHEISHGIYYLNNDYFSEINSFLSSMGRINFSKMQKYLTDEGVTCRENLRDEIHAHLLTNHYVFMPKISEKSLNKYNRGIEKIFKKYWKD
jgi:hypothetical protein